MRLLIPSFAGAAFAVSALLLMAPALNSSAQQIAASAAPVVWERYKVGKQHVSVLLPKLPVAFEKPLTCDEVRSDTYYAYAEGAIYELTIVYKGPIARFYNNQNNGMRFDCGAPDRKFDKNAILDRLTALRSDKFRNVETPVTQNGQQAYKFSNEAHTRWIFPDMENKRWVELSVYHRRDVKIDEDRFASSLKLAGDDGIEIGKGSVIMLGDAGVETAERPVSQQLNPASEEAVIIYKPIATYSELASRNNVQGSLKLNVELLANGGIGKVTTVTALPFGLTERAIAAARKIVFVPKRMGGTQVTTTLTFVYSFTFN